MAQELAAAAAGEVEMRTHFIRRLTTPFIILCLALLAAFLPSAAGAPIAHSPQRDSVGALIHHGSSDWHIETVDSGGNSGSDGLSLALDRWGYPHIAYSKSPADLRYAYWDGSNWHIETVEGEGKNVGAFPSLVLDSLGRPHISYLEEHADHRHDLKYAHWDGSVWHIETVESPWYIEGNPTRNSLALDGAGRPHIAYHELDNEDLNLAWWDGSAWIIETIDSEGDAGNAPSLVLDGAGRPHISYSNDLPGLVERGLRYGHWDGSGWQLETIAPYFSHWPSLELDTSGYPHIAYQHDDRAINYAHWDGSAWYTETVDSGGDVYNVTYSSLALDRTGRPHIACLRYVPSVAYEVEYAYWDGSAWHIEAAISYAEPGIKPHIPVALALDAAGRPHISCYDYDNRALVYARKGAFLDFRVYLAVILR